ncbi:hypothetical protein Q3G72_002287 [Acer saccharum]|nr:hypothetical protein Q3G72_002287 [Acer saccharum]
MAYIFIEAEVGPEGPSNINIMKITSGSSNGNIQKGKRCSGCDFDTNEKIIKAVEFSMVELPIAFNKSKIRKILEEQIIMGNDMGSGLSFDFYDKEVRMADAFAEVMLRATKKGKG